MKQDIIRFTEDMTEIQVLGGQVQGVKSQKIQKSSGRLYKEGQIFSSAIVGEASDAQLLETADKKGNVGVAYEYDLPSTKAITSVVSVSDSREKGLQNYIEALSYLVKKYPNLVWNGSANFTKVETQFTSNYTEKLHSVGESSTALFMYKRVGSPDYVEGYCQLTGRDFNFMAKLGNLERIAVMAESRATIDTKKMPVLLIDSWDISKRLSEDIRPEKYHSGGSFLSGKIGDTLFHKDVSFEDIGFSPEHGLFRKFDGEGVAHQQTQIFCEGIFSSLVYDLRQGHKYKALSTGNGLRSFNTGVACGLQQLTLKNGKSSMWDMLKSLPECLVAVLAHGGGINEQWDYSTPVQVGHLYRYGKPIGRVPSVSIKGRLDELLGNDLIGISNDGFHSSLGPAILTQLNVIVH